MSNIEITLRKSGSFFDMNQKEEAQNPQAKQTHHLSIDQNTIPRTYIDHNVLIPYAISQPSLGSSFSLENDKIREILAGEMGVAPSVVFDDIKGIVTKLSNKITAAEHASGNTVNTISKLLSKLQKTIPALVTNEGAGNQQQDLILQIYGMLILLTSETNKLSVSAKQLDKVREQLNEKLGISELSATNNGGEIGAQGGSSAPPIKLFAKLPKQILDSGLEKPELMRLSAVYELIETEIDYVQDLKTMINFHRKEVAIQLGDNDANLIFSNIEQLLAANQALANKLNIKREHNMFVSEVGDLLIDCAESFTVYSVYSANYPAAMKLLSRPEMKEVLQKLMAAPDARGLSLESFLIKPVQRICKYPLLIRDLGKYTEKAGNIKDTELLRKAAEKIEAVVSQVNEATRAAEEKQRILGLGNLIESATPLSVEDKVHLKDGPLLRIEKGGKTKERYIILYTDLILICSPIIRQPPVRGPTKYELECGYSLAELTFTLNVKDSAHLKNLKNNYLFSLNVISEDKDTILLMANTPEEYAKWTDAFQNAFRDITEEHRSAVRSLEAQQKATDRSGFLIGGSRKNLKTGGLSVIAAKRAIARKSQFPGLGIEGHETLEPESVKINGIVYNRALSVLGIPYYYNNKEKSSMWKLPANYQLVDENAPSLEDTEFLAPATQQATFIIAEEMKETPKLDQKDDKDVKDNTQSKSDTDEEDSDLWPVEGYSNWRKVERKGEIPYYFHILTQETRWDPPTAQ